MKAWRKYWAVVRTTWQTSMVYRVDFLLWGMSEFIDTIVWMFVWLVVYRDRPPLAGFEVQDTVTYFLLIGLFGVLTNTWIDGELSELIKGGRLSELLVKPLRVVESLVVKHWGDVVFDVVVRLIIYVGVIVVFTDFFYFPKSWWSVSWVAVSVLLGTIWSYLFHLCVGCMSFWLVNTRGMRGFVNMVVRVMGGVYAPLEFFPKWFQVVAKGLPFAYERYFPVMIYLEKLEVGEVAIGLVVQVGWVLAWLVLFRWLWRRGLQRYEGVGI